MASEGQGQRFEKLAPLQEIKINDSFKNAGPLSEFLLKSDAQLFVRPYFFCEAILISWKKNIEKSIVSPDWPEEGTGAAARQSKELVEKHGESRKDKETQNIKEHQQPQENGWNPSSPLSWKRRQKRAVALEEI